MNGTKRLILSCAIALLVLLLPESAAQAAVYTPPIRTCELPGARIGRSSPAPADLDGDGILEIVAAGSDGWVYAVDVVDNCRLMWRKQVADFINPLAARPSGQSIQSSPTAADLTGDGKVEIVITTGWMPEYHMNGAIVVLDRFGNLMPGWPRLTLDVHGAGDPPWNPDGYSDGFFATPAVGDVNGDGIPEIVAGAFDKCLYVLRPDGSPAPGWWDTANNKPSRCFPDTIWSSAALADLDGDGLNEIILGTDSHPQYNGGSVWVFRGNNTIYPGWPVYTTQIIQSSPAVADLNGDGTLEIVVGTGTNYPGTGGYKVYAFDRNGGNFPGWPVATSGNMPNSPALADLDGDGKMEVIIGCGAEPDFANPSICNGNHMYVLRYNGTAMPGYPASVRKAIPWDPAAYGAVAIPPVIADINGDAKAEILVVAAGAIGVTSFTYSSPGAPSLYTPALIDPLEAAPLLSDLDGNGSLSIITAGSKGGKAALFMWNVGGTEDARPWPMYRGNTTRTGQVSSAAPRLAVSPVAIHLFHQRGTTTPEIAMFTVANQGGASLTWQAKAPSGVSLSQASGVVEGQPQVVKVTVQTQNYPSLGTYTVGEIVITATYDNEPVTGSPVRIPVELTVANVRRVYFPSVLRRSSP
ncbi:MAG: VCBS repeat-containing protein [Chloroflexi bacterium]|nr:VCBS repeat-containing protein [Chloroflexota bacterium]